MEKTTIAILIISILVLGSFAGFLGLSDKAADDSETDESVSDNGKPADTSYTETFVFSLLGGGVKNTSEYSGKIVLLDFMGATCGPCQSMMLVLKDISEHYKDQIEIVSIDVWITLGETPELLQEFVDYYRENGVDLDWTFGYDDTSGTLFTKYASNSGVPLILILDEDGNIYYTKGGYIDGVSDYAVLAEKIDDLIG